MFNINMIKVGILTESIRGDWNDIGDRICEIKHILYQEGRVDLLNEINESIDYIYSDGRWFRDCWSGPYISLARSASVDTWYGYNSDQLEIPGVYEKVRSTFKLCEHENIVRMDFMYNYRSCKHLYIGIVAREVKNGRNPKDLSQLIRKFVRSGFIVNDDPLMTWEDIGGKLLSLSDITLDEYRKIEKKSYFIGF